MSLCLGFFAGPLMAQSNLTRLALVDFSFDAQKPEDKNLVRPVIEEILSKRSPIPLVNPEEVAQRLIVKNVLREKFELDRTDQINRLAEIRSQVEEAKRLYSSSQFDEVTRRLSVVFRSIDAVSWVLDAELTLQILQLMAASEWFLGNERGARQYFSALLDLEPLFVLDTQRFPPPIVSLFAEVQTQPRFPKRRVTFRSSAAEVSVNFLGKRVDIDKSADRLWSVFLPIGHPILGSKNLVVFAPNVVPRVLGIANVPSEIATESLLDRQYSTSGVFGVLNNATPSPRFLEIAGAVKAQILLLAEFSQDLRGGWLARAQWYNVNSLEGSVVLSQEGTDVQLVTSLLMARMVDLLSTDGIRPEALLKRQMSSQAIQQKNQEEKFYHRWWFWTAVGAVAIGAGVGTYFLLSPEKETRFRVQEAP